MWSDADCERAARHLLASRRRGELAGFPDGMPIPEPAAAYRIHHTLRALLDESAADACKVSGLKRDGKAGGIGTPGPFFATLPAGSLRASGAVVAPGRFPIGVECEIAVRLDLSPEGDASVRDVMAALELIERRLPPVGDTSLALYLADGLASCGGVLSEARDDWPHEIEHAPVRIFIDGDCVYRGCAGDRIPHPRVAVDAYVRQAPAHGFALRDGLVLFTGNLCGEFWLQPGSHVRAEIGGLPPVDLRIGAKG